MSTTLGRIRSRLYQQETKLNRLQDRLVVMGDMNTPKTNNLRVETEARVSLLVEEVSWLKQQEEILSGQGQDIWSLVQSDGKTVPIRGGRGKWGSPS